MPKKTVFDTLRQRSEAAAVRWGGTLRGKPLPVPLHELAESLQVKHVRFEPLLSTAGISKAQDGFAIFVNTEARGASQSQGTVLGLDQDTWAGFEPSIRFTLAHELAHLLFFEAADRNWKSDLFRRHERALERACIEIAGLLLMPRNLLLSEASNRLLDVFHVAQLLSSFGVSAEVFMLRLYHSDLLDALRCGQGMLAFVREELDGIRIVACELWGEQAWAKFGRGPELPPEAVAAAGSSQKTVRKTRIESRPNGRLLNSLGLGVDMDAWLRDGASDRNQLDLSVSFSPNTVLPCKLSAHQINWQPLGFLVAIEA